MIFLFPFSDLELFVGVKIATVVGNKREPFDWLSACLWSSALTAYNILFVLFFSACCFTWPYNFFFPLKFELNLIFSQAQMNLNIIG